jgi:hypothetical protein
MAYYMIYVRDAGQWSPQFGDKDRTVVKDERVDTYLRERGYGYEGDGRYAAKDIRIEKFARVPNQTSVNLRTLTLNEGEG